MSILFEKPIKINRIITMSIEEARALEDPLRATMLDLLSRKPMSVEELARELRKVDKRYDKALTTIRYHLDSLKRAGLIELVKMKEVGGAVLKYYASRAKLLSYALPQDFEDNLKDIVEYTSREVSNLIQKIVRRYREEIIKTAEKLKPCPYCVTQHFKEYVIIEILQLAIARAIQTEEFKKVLKIKT